MSSKWRLDFGEASGLVKDDIKSCLILQWTDVLVALHYVLFSKGSAVFLLFPSNFTESNAVLRNADL